MSELGSIPMEDHLYLIGYNKSDVNFFLKFISLCYRVKNRSLQGDLYNNLIADLQNSWSYIFVNAPTEIKKIYWSIPKNLRTPIYSTQFTKKESYRITNGETVYKFFYWKENSKFIYHLNKKTFDDISDLVEYSKTIIGFEEMKNDTDVTRGLQYHGT